MFNMWNKNYEKQFGEDWTKRFLKTYRFSIGHINPVVPVDPSTLLMATIFTQKIQESSGSMYSCILMLENI